MLKNIHLKKPHVAAAFFSVCCGILVHLFGLVNVLHNYDDIAQQPKGYGTGITSGRWFLSVLGDAVTWLGGNHNLPVFNGVLFLLLIGLSAGLLVLTLRMKNWKYAVLAGMLFSVFPSAFSTLVFRYTSVYYGLGIFLAIAAVYLLPVKKYGLILSALCTAMSLGIYQAYVPITVTLFVLLLIQQAVRGDSTFWELVRKGCYYCFALVLGLLFYYALLQLFLNIYGVQLSDYQGMNQMGSLSLKALPSLVKEAVYSFCMLPVKDYCGLAASKISKLCYVLLGLITGGILASFVIKNRKKPLHIVFLLCMCAVFPIAVNFIVIMCPESWIYTLMVYSFILVPCVPMILDESRTEQEKKQYPQIEKVTAVVLAVLIFSYSYQTNVNYTALHYSNRQIENYLASMVTQIRMTDGFDTEKKWVFVGEIEDPLLRSYWQYEMSYGGVESTQWMLKRYSVGEWIRNYYGYSYPEADEELTERISSSELVEQMPVWPNAGSVKVIDECVVIKFAGEDDGL